MGAEVNVEPPSVANGGAAGVAVLAVHLDARGLFEEFNIPFDLARPGIEAEGPQRLGGEICLAHGDRRGEVNLPLSNDG